MLYRRSQRYAYWEPFPLYLPHVFHQRVHWSRACSGWNSKLGKVGTTIAIGRFREIAIESGK
ncbi:hypothetical protein ACVWXL_000327 [Bradyrhizobium sp. GM22.5]